MKTIIVVCLYILGAIIYGIWNTSGIPEVKKKMEDLDESKEWSDSDIMIGIFIVLIAGSAIWPVCFIRYEIIGTLTNK